MVCRVSRRYRYDLTGAPFPVGTVDEGCDGVDVSLYGISGEVVENMKKCVSIR